MTAASFPAAIVTRFAALLYPVVASRSVAAAEMPLVPGAVLNTARIMEVLGGLALVLLLIVALAYLSQRVGRLQHRRGQHIQILEGLPLSTRERLLLVDVDGERVLLGVSGGHIERLHVCAQRSDFPAQLHDAIGTDQQRALG